MRTIFIGLLLATVAAAPPQSNQSQNGNSSPATAQHHGGSRHSGGSGHSGRSGHSGGLQSPNASRPSVSGPIHDAHQVNLPASGASGTGQIAHPVERQRTIAPNGAINVTPNEKLRGHSGGQRGEGAHLDSHHSPHVLPQRPVVSTVPRPGTEPPLRNFNHSNHRSHWSPAWRNEHRYDWRNWRQHNRYRYHFRPYLDPFGWGYYRYSVGWRLWPRYYGSNFWISDPGYYRLPPAPPGTQWVRYYNDALLVDTWTGEVIDVIYDFFW